MELKGELKVEISRKKVTIDKKYLSPCQYKEVEVWSWKRLKHEIWIVHGDEGGNINIQKVSPL